MALSASDMRATLARRAPALWLSIAIHAAVLYGVSRVSFVADAPEPAAPPPVVWLEESPASPLPEPVPEAEAPSPAAPEMLPPPARQTPSPPEPEPDTRATPRAEPAVEPEAAADSEAEAEAVAESDTQSRSELPPDVDWDEERERAIDMVLERQARERSYRSFSSDGSFGETDTDGDPIPGTSGIFEGGSRGGGGGGSVLGVGQSRSKLLNGLAELCNALTGGLGIGFQGFSLGTACAERAPRADYFGHLRPAYMEKLPVCTEPVDARGQPAVFDADGNEIPTAKCRLVEKDASDGLPVEPP